MRFSAERLVAWLSFLILAVSANAAAVYQFAVPVGERGHAFLWVPEKCVHVRGIIFSMENLLERAWLEDPAIRGVAAEQGLAVVYLPGRDSSLTWEMKPESVAAFERMCDDLARESGYEEIASAPVIWIGHSFHGRVWMFASALPERTIAAIPIRTYPLPASLGFSGIPICYLVGQTTELPQFNDGRPGDRDFFWPVVRDTALGLRAANEDNLIGVAVYPGGTHTDWSEAQGKFIALFIRKACERRLSADGTKLKAIARESGWLADSGLIAPDRFPPASYREYRGDPKRAFWFFDEEMARAATALDGDRRPREKQMVTLMQDGALLPVQPGLTGVRLRFEPRADGRTFDVTGAFLEAVPAGLVDAGAKLGHASEGEFRFAKIRGPIVSTGPGTFHVQFDALDFATTATVAPGRAGNEVGASLNVEHPGDAKYRRAIQPVGVEFPLRLTEGKPQRVEFPPIGNQPANAREVALRATADSGLPVDYFIVVGPAIIEGSTLRIAEVPARARRPIKITVAAWQWGRTIEPRFRSAEIIERTFFLEP